MNENEAYKTADMILAAYLKTIGFDIIDIEIIKDKNVRYSFNRAIVHLESGPNMNDAISSFYNAKTMVDAMTFYNNVKAIKSRVMNMSGGGY